MKQAFLPGAMLRDRLSALLKNNECKALLLFFALLLLLGAMSYRDFGLGIDEIRNRDFGIANYNYVLNGGEFPGYFESHERTHGPVFEVALVLAEKGLGLKEEEHREIFLMRHFMTYLLFCAGVFFFYLLCKRLFGDWRAALLGCLFLAINPRVFAHAFFNSVDIAFTVFFIASIYTMLKFIGGANTKWAGIHALACALLIGVRVVGAIVPVFTVLFFAPEFFRKGEKKWRLAGALVLFAGLAALFSFLFWPFLWANPAENLLAAFTETTDDPLSTKMLYLGSYIDSRNAPWHFTPVWMLVTIPLLYIALFAAGLAALAAGFVSRRAKRFIGRRESSLVLLWLFLPIAMSVALASTMFNEWRHFFFVWPAFVIIALSGLLGLLALAQKLLGENRKKAVLVAAALLVFLGLLEPALFMAQWYPHYYVYFNALAGKDMQEAGQNFDLDYWGISYRQGWEYLLRNMHGDIKADVASGGGTVNLHILSIRDRSRIYCDSLNGSAGFFISTHYGYEGGYPYEEYHSIMVGNAKILSIYRVEAEPISRPS